VQVAQLAGDNRFGIIALLFLPALGWVGFNILQPFLNQLDAMSGEKAAPKKAGKKCAFPFGPTNSLLTIFLPIRRWSWSCFPS
jgi:hypothetical protein